MTGCEGPGVRLVEAARKFVGTPFRLHGRDPARGLDCIGLVHAALIAIGRQPIPPQGYHLRNLDASRWFGFAQASGLATASGEIRPGDVVLLRPGPAQQHLVIAEDRSSAIHAHAGLRRVVCQPMHFPADPLAHWRLI